MITLPPAEYQPATSVAIEAPTSRVRDRDARFSRRRRRSKIG
jgi:hypothetical protein